MDTDLPNAAKPQPQRYGVRGLVRAFYRRLVAVERKWSVQLFPRAAEPALLWRRVARAAKAVTSHRTPNPCRPGVKFDGLRGVGALFILAGTSPATGTWIEFAVQMNNAQVIRATEEDIPAIVALAGVIWRAHYPGIISHAQIDYMLARMYSLQKLRAEIQSNEICYERLLFNGEFVAFASHGPTETSGEFKLHKLYLLPAFHGRGLGSLLLQHCEKEVCRLGARRLFLAVNKRNARAIAAYQRNGFRIADSIVTDIGGGFVMDDYVMVKEFPHEALKS